ncbi:hypothetical protein BC834DRAFT_491052 [Gloeopeniophorella convolvens]|nr:hypothetical protein BC834DRAFT_491052 [Gloeopeniophorella convolvens]
MVEPLSTAFPDTVPVLSCINGGRSLAIFPDAKCPDLLLSSPGALPSPMERTTGRAGMDAWIDEPNFSDLFTFEEFAEEGQMWSFPSEHPESPQWRTVEDRQVWSYPIEYPEISQWRTDTRQEWDEPDHFLPQPFTNSLLSPAEPEAEFFPWSPNPVVRSVPNQPRLFVPVVGNPLCCPVSNVVKDPPRRTPVDIPRLHKFDDPRYWRMIEDVVHYDSKWKVRNVKKLDSWLRNMTRLSGVIGLLEKLASSAPPDRQPGINRQVNVLWSSLKKQQERYIEFLQLSRDYANKFLLDMSSTIIGQEEFLDTLEKRLDMAKELHTQAVVLQDSYRSEIAGPVEDILKTVLSEPLPPDTGIVNEVDSVLTEIRRCHIAMNNFWLDEAQRADKALKTGRLGDDDVARWKGFRVSFNQAIASSKDLHSKGSSEHQSLADPPLSAARPLNISAIVPALLFAVHLAFNALSRMRLCSSIEALRGSLQGMAIRKILHVQSKFQGNIELCIGFFRRCAEYGDTVTACGSVAVSKLVSSHVKDLQGLRNRMGQLRYEVYDAPPAALDAAHDDSVISAGTRKSSLVYAESISLLRKLDNKLCTLLDTAASWMAAPDEVDAIPSGLTPAQLKKMKRVWSERNDALDRALEVVMNGDQTKDASPARGGRLPGFLRSMARGIRHLVIH